MIGPAGFMQFPKSENERLYHVVSIREKDGQKVYMTAYPDTHKHCCTIMSKITVHKHRRIQLEEFKHEVLG